MPRHPALSRPAKAGPAPRRQPRATRHSRLTRRNALPRVTTRPPARARRPVGGRRPHEGSTPMANDQPMTGERLWTPEETAAYLGIPKATLYQWHYLGTGPVPGKVGRHLRYHPDDVRDWFRRQQAEG